MNYNEVVEKAKKTLIERGHYGSGNVDLYAGDLWLAGDQINLWAYWQGHQYKDIDENGIDILLVGQDWGNPNWDTASSERVSRIQAGEDILYCGEKITATDRNLIDLFKEFHCNIEKKNHGKRILFTNYCLGYRNCPQSGGMTRNLLSMDKELFDDLVRAVRPKIIICLGKLTYEAVTGQKIKGFSKQLKEGIPYAAEYPMMKEIKVYGVAHCGGLGIRNVGGLDKAKKAWIWIAEEINR